MKKSFLTLSMLLGMLIVYTTTPVIAQEEKGDMIFIVSEEVSPANWEAFEKYLMDFKKIADETAGPSYAVRQNRSGFSYFMNFGKDMAGMDEMNKMWQSWPGNEKAMELNKAHAHMINASTTTIWRHSPKHSYSPEGYDDSVERNYSRITWYWLTPYSMDKANEIIAEYKALWTESGVSYPVDAWWNVVGEDGPVVAMVSNYVDEADYLAESKEIEAKVDKEKLGALRKNWFSIVRKMDLTESWARNDLAHFNETENAAGN